MNLHTVLTGDIVNSTKLAPREEKKLILTLKELLEPNKYEFYRGDSFQVYIEGANKALVVVMRCRAAAISAGETVKCDVRMSVGIGGVIVPVEELSTAQGEAFVLSGRAFDEFTKADKRLAIGVGGEGREAIGIGMNLIAAHVDAIFRDMTLKQAEVILELLKGKTQQEAAAALSKSKSTISQLVSSGRWSEIEKLCVQYENLINLLK